MQHAGEAAEPSYSVIAPSEKHSLETTFKRGQRRRRRDRVWKTVPHPRRLTATADGKGTVADGEQTHRRNNESARRRGWAEHRRRRALHIHYRRHFFVGMLYIPTL